jgi:hypothetical protein
VANFDFAAAPAIHRNPRSFLLLLERSSVDLCGSDPG